MDETIDGGADPTASAASEQDEDDCECDESDDFETDPEELQECRRLCRRPFFRAVHEDCLSLLSPRLWAGLARLRRVSFENLGKGIKYVLGPPFLYSLAYAVAHSPWLIVGRGAAGRESHPRPPQPDTGAVRLMPRPRTVAIPYALSPWALYHAYRACKPIFTLAAQVAAFRTVFRSRILDEAVVELGRRIRQHRARRCDLYDLYLPPPSNENEDDPATFVLFLPGAGVSPVAYSRPASMLSDAGMHVVVVNTEGTLRLSSHHVGYTTERCRSIQLDALSSASSEAGKAVATRVRWVGVGHSMGCFTLSHLNWKELQLKKVAFWGISPLFVQDLADLSSSSSFTSSCGDNAASEAPSPSPPLLIVQGSDDALNRIAASTNPDLERQFYAKLPSISSSSSSSIGSSNTGAGAGFSTPLAHVVIVEGGTHRGFASYESRLLVEPQGCGQRARQQRRAVDLTVEFVLKGR
jgi:hypothetical protein